MKLFLVFSLLMANLTYAARADHPMEVLKDERLNLVDVGKEKIRDWFNLDYVVNGVAGVSADILHGLIKVPYRRRDVIVAVIDSGVDVRHPDLAGKIWVNKREIPGNGIDDDQNGYVDDIHGWNFLGSRNAKKETDFENLAVIREIRRYKKVMTKRQLSQKEQSRYAYLQADLRRELKRAHARRAIAKARGNKRAYNYFHNRINKSLNINFNIRKSVVGDDPSKIREFGYGNNQVIGPDASHGTHVAGAIAAVRHNGIGMNGVASRVKIMALRAVPNGDEYDKDIINSIYYAVNNGAKIINMSFGKSYSLYRKHIDKAIAYAKSKGVLLFHAAGNDGKNNDRIPSYPSKFTLDRRVHTNFIEVGASRSNTKILSFKNRLGNIERVGLAASFSNYGKRTVDFFSPGVNIYSTIPVDLKVNPDKWYDSYNGTSMATPVAAGVAALIWSISPNLSAQDLKAVLLKTVTPYHNLTVIRPGNNALRSPVKFGTLSRTGGVINAVKAAKYLGLIK